MEEQLDIFNDKYELIGTAGKKEVHIQGMWHRVFTCILVDPKTKSVLLQKKVSGRYSFERRDYVDVSVGGHYLAGESISDGVRELEEEVGIKSKFEDLVPIGVRQTADTIKEDYVAYEFQHIFIYPSEKTLEEYELEASEVKGLVRINIQDGIDLLLGKRDKVYVKGVCSGEKGKELYETELTAEDFVPSYLKKDQFFLRLFVAAKRFVRGDELDEIFC